MLKNTLPYQILGLLLLQSSASLAIAEAPKPITFAKPLGVKGYVTRLLPVLQEDGGYVKKSMPEIDARVFLCTEENACDTAANTVTDSSGFFCILLTSILPDKQYSLRVRPIGDQFVDKQIGNAEQIISRSEPILIQLIGNATKILEDKGGANNQHPVDAKMSVLFATDRGVRVQKSDVQILNENSSSNKLSYGRCEVVIETNGIYDRLINYISDIGRGFHYYFSVQRISLLSKEDMSKDFAHQLKGTPKNDALLFIHGYKTSFDDACRQAAQIAYDLKFAGPVLVYSWPSHDSWGAYAGDEEMAEWTGPHFMEFLKGILSTNGLHHLHIIAHSMGNRVLTRALFSGGLSKDEQAHLGQLVLAAPDVNRLIFDQENVLSQLKRERMTLYASNHDQALQASGTFHGYTRVGDSKPEMYLRDGMDSVDASDVDTSLAGHSYISGSSPVLEDLAALVSSNAGPDNRLRVVKTGHPPKQWWYLQPK